MLRADANRCGNYNPIHSPDTIGFFLAVTTAEVDFPVPVLLLIPCRCKILGNPIALTNNYQAPGQIVLRI